MEKEIAVEKVNLDFSKHFSTDADYKELFKIIRMRGYKIDKINNIQISQDSLISIISTVDLKTGDNERILIFGISGQPTYKQMCEVAYNDDLDIIVSSKLRNQNISFPKDIDVFDANSKKFNYFGASGDDDLIQNYCVVIDGYKFLEPRFYFARKNRNSTQRDINDWKAIKTFFGRGGHNGYPFNFEFYKWGVTYVNEVQISDLKFDNFSIIRNKIDKWTFLFLLLFVIFFIKDLSLV